jgi:hypothetical protein
VIKVIVGHRIRRAVRCEGESGRVEGHG